MSIENFIAHSYSLALGLTNCCWHGYFKQVLAWALLKKTWNIRKLNKVGSVIHGHLTLLHNFHGGLLTHLTNCDNLFSSKMLSIVNSNGLCTPSYVHLCICGGKKKWLMIFWTYYCHIEWDGLKKFWLRTPKTNKNNLSCLFWELSTKTHNPKKCSHTNLASNYSIKQKASSP